MMTDLKDLLARTEETLFQDALGVSALMVILFAGLHMPGLF